MGVLCPTSGKLCVFLFVREGEGESAMLMNVNTLFLDFVSDLCCVWEIVEQ